MCAVIAEVLEDRRLLVANLQLNAAILVDPQNVPQANPVFGQNTFVRAEWSSQNFVGNEAQVSVQYTANYPADYFYPGSAPTSMPARSATISMGIGNGGWVWYRDGWYSGTTSYTMTVTVDPDNLIAESNELDNTLTITVNPVAPASLPSKFVQPIGGIPNQDWAIGNYADINPSPNIAQDYRLGVYQYEGHDAIDAGPWGFDSQDRGIPIVAAASGVVSEIHGGDYFDRQTTIGNQDWNGVVIDHGNGWKTIYGHLAANSITVKVGQSVSAGQLLGLMGSSGRSTGTHVHYTALYRGAQVEAGFAPNSYWVDPLPYGGDAPKFAYASGITKDIVGADSNEAVTSLTTFPSSGSGTSAINFWVQYYNLDNGDVLGWKFYRPDGSLAFSNSFAVASDYRGSWWYWNRSLSNFQSSVGTWQVGYEVDGVELSRSSFTIAAAGDASIRVSDSSNKVLLDGRTTPLDLGSVAQGGTAPQMTVTIANQGFQALSLSNFQLPPGFSFVGTPPTSVAVGGTATFTIRMDTAVVGNKFGALQFNTNDPDSPVYDLIVKGTVTGTAPAGSPVITIPPPAAAHDHGAPPTLLSPLVTLTDSNSVNFNGGNLTVEFATFGDSNDRLAIRHEGTGVGQIGVSGNTVTYGGTTIGSFSGGTGTTPLSFSLNANATVAATEALLRNLTYQYVGSPPTTQRKAIRLTLTDGTGNTSNLAIQHVINSGIAAQGGTPDIILNSVQLNGGNQLTINYDILNAAVGAFDLAFYWSYDELLDIGGSPNEYDDFVEAIAISNLADRSVGTHTLTYTLGVDLYLPGNFVYDSPGHDYLLAVLDDLDNVTETDAADWSGPFNEDNTRVVQGVYHVAGDVVMALGSAINDSMVVTASGANLNLNFNGTVYSYLASDVSGFSFRGNVGNDTLTTVNIDKPVTLMGGVGNDTLTGGKQGDSIVDGSGSDSITGGLGNDWYYRDEDLLVGSDTLTDAGGIDTIDFRGTDNWNVTFSLALTTVQEATPGSFLKLASASAIDNVIGGVGNDLLTGNTLANVMEGYWGNDTLVGGSGNDTYVHNLDADVLNDSAGIDTIDFSFSSLQYTLNLGLTTLQVTNGNGSLTLNSATAFENVIGGENDDLLIGNTAINRIEGRGGNDTLQGAAGNDVYVRNEDMDLGSDVITDSAGLDTLDFSPTSSARNVTVSLALTTAQETTSGNFLTLTSASMLENLIGGAGNDNLIGNTLANTFTGGAGNDTLNGGAGNDVYPFDVDLVQGTDTIIDSSGTDKIDFALSTAAVSINLGLTGNQTVRAGFLVLNLASATSMESLNGGAGHDTLIGNSLANTILGNAGNDNMQGAGGNDSLTGGAGNDTLAGGQGDDKYLFPAASGTENDRISELAGEGLDLLDFSTLAVAVTVNLSSATVATHTGRTITAVGGEEANFDHVTGGKVDDNITGNALNNNLIGGTGNDVLNGMAGNDTLEGAAGNDTLIGGLGDDNYLFKAAVGSEFDVVTELFNEGIDHLNFSGLASTVPVNVSLISNTIATHTGRTVSVGVAGQFDNFENVTGGAGNDTIVGNGNHNVLIGGSGNDTISGGAGNDTIQGVAGNDTLDGGADLDTIDGGTGTDSAVNGEVVTNVP